jgi:hypothetical protein
MAQIEMPPVRIFFDLRINPAETTPSGTTRLLAFVLGTGHW